jgi:hypothetical protein
VPRGLAQTAADRRELRIEVVGLISALSSVDTGELAAFYVKSDAKNGTHPIEGDELRELRRLQPEQEPKSPFVFTSQQAPPFTTAGFARLVERAGRC